MTSKTRLINFTVSNLRGAKELEGAPSGARLVLLSNDLIFAISVMLVVTHVQCSCSPLCNPRNNCNQENLENRQLFKSGWSHN